MAELEFQLSRFEEEPVLGIIRGITRDSLKGVIEAAVGGGLRYVEITLNTPDAPKLIEAAAKEFSQSLCIGAGTVLSCQDVETALSAGAKFLVAPTVNGEVAAFCRKKGIPFFPGAFSPTEIESAWNAGAAMVKVFPASQLGPAYFREIKGPFQNIRLLAVGGIKPSNVSEYLANGAFGVAVGGSVFTVPRMENREFSKIRADIEEFLLAVRSFFFKIA